MEGERERERMEGERERERERMEGERERENGGRERARERSIVKMLSTSFVADLFYRMPSAQCCLV